jgi:hypothetical protein
MVQGERQGANFNLVHTDNPVFQATFVEEAVSIQCLFGVHLTKIG